MPLLTLNHLQYSVGGPPLLDHVDLAIEAGERICVLDAREQPLFCPTPEMLGEQRATRSDGTRTWAASWNLFLRSDFGVEDWTLVNLSPACRWPRRSCWALRRRC